SLRPQLEHSSHLHAVAATPATKMPSVANLSLPGTALPGAVTVTIADGDALKKQIAQYVATIAKACTKDRFVVALSGGSMPKLLTGLLDLDVDWSKWDVFFADERCVPLVSNDSNYKACEDHLFSKIKGEKPTIHTLDTSLSPAQAAEKYGDELNSVGRRFDLCLLGMGPDGHTASLFPEHDLFRKPDGSVARCILDSPKPPSERVTFTLSTLQNSVRVCFVATGDSKTPVLKEILARKEGKLDYAYPVPPYPAAWVRSADGGAQWFLDSAAGGGL
ncbi:unnamed protein product, partial [Pelagomonas calceolata]